MLSTYDLAIDTFVPMLSSLKNLLAKGSDYAKARSVEPAVLVRARLAPDMFPLNQQVQLACHHAQDGVARLTGTESTPIGSPDETYETLTTRVVRTIDRVRRVPQAAFEGAESRDIRIAFADAGIAFEMNGAQFLRDWALPQFYFHLVTAYGILRHSGVEIGKADYGGIAGPYIRPLAPAKG
jgi:hypothetical protein